MTAFVLGLVQFAAPKGTLPHRTLGWIWVVLMAAVAISSFWIHQIRLVGPWSPIHLLSIFTLMMLPLAVWRAHRHRVAAHRRIMIWHFLRRACHRRAVHAAAGADHARRRVRPIAALGRQQCQRIFGFQKPPAKPVPEAGSQAFPRRLAGPRKSLEKRREKPLGEGRLRVVWRPPMRYMILKQELTGFPLCLTLKISPPASRRRLPIFVPYPSSTR